MDTPKALLAALVVTVGLLGASFGFEGIAQVLGPEEEEEEHAEEEEHDEVDEADEDARTIDAGDEEEGGAGGDDEG